MDSKNKLNNNIDKQKIGINRVTLVDFVGTPMQEKFGTALDTITPSKSIKDPEFIISQSGVFRLGFFSFANSSNRYVGILYNQIPVQTVAWVANRNKPLKDSSGILNISNDGNLVVLNGKTEILWSSNVTNTAPNTTTAELLDSGNLILSNGDDGGSSLWESFEDPSNAFIETMKISTDVKKGRKVELKSWKSPGDPSDGNFSFGIEPFNIPEGIIRKNNQIYFRTGPWNGNMFLGAILMTTVYIDGFYVVADNQQQTFYMAYEYSNDSILIYCELDSQGKFIERRWDAGKGNWINRYSSYQTDCDVYGYCGAFGICDSSKRPVCSCLKGFKPRNIEEWSRGNWSSGCFRTTLLQCQRDNNNGSGGAGQGDDGFLKMMKFSTSGVDLYDLYIRLPSSELDKGKKTKVIVITTVIAGIVVITISALFLWCRMAKQRVGSTLIPLSERNEKRKHIKHKIYRENSIGVKLQQLPLFNFKQLAIATNNFNHAKKLGQGGFGLVYKGILDDGKEIAVKRLSKASGQGLEEFVNEVVVISKLQHRNLVRLFGCCVDKEEKMLVYEYMLNKSLDAFIFDWRKRFNTIEGISRGLLYLYRDSRLRIIHRDLKASNVLLDRELNPKISDFGMARIFGGDENQAITKRVVGTYGYMSPEYAMRGQFSEKSDVFSYGVLLLEIISGRRNISFYNKDDLGLLGYAWKLWNEGNIWNLVDKVISESESDSKNEKEIWRCIHIGLLCVQEYANDRPTMSTVVSIINSEISDLNTPKQPAFTQAPLINQDVENTDSLNDVTLTKLNGR
ncbi:hypothetical protein GOBAR_AA14618 [Gossypium barbadense]|uniref:Receptor-like serine/threonine-protein kinase n=1 Tax=Gossypium barbadense TaxID=3634 RepID=A0A2P5XRP5_GOSBA|nr:hypothetical protein GOBAR_AA14618 [Gossypium barbadense]